MSEAKNRKKRIPLRNKSPYGWWIASYIERFEYEDENKDDLNRRCVAWENTIIIKARNREQAYRKAEKLGRLSESNGAYKTVDGRIAIWRYEGVTSLLPIYEELEDGAEILWKEHQNRTVKKIKSLVRSKSELEAFDDNEGAA
jgi:hypothetical protein